jgi:hypothetical protein
MLTTRQILSETSPSAASTVAGTARAYGLAACEGLTVVGQLVGATGGTLDVYLQTAYDAADVADASATWFDFAHFTQLAAGAAAVKVLWHVNRATAVSTVTTIGSGTSPALAAATILGGSWGNRMRLLFTAGAGTSVGAATSVTLIGHRMQ